jgi:hypothetical protein
MHPFTTGAAYLNFTGEGRVREAFGDAKYARRDLDAQLDRGATRVQDPLRRPAPRSCKLTPN